MTRQGFISKHSKDKQWPLNDDCPYQLQKFRQFKSCSAWKQLPIGTADNISRKSSFDPKASNRCIMSEQFLKSSIQMPIQAGQICSSSSIYTATSTISETQSKRKKKGGEGICSKNLSRKPDWIRQGLRHSKVIHRKEGKKSTEHLSVGFFCSSTVEGTFFCSMQEFNHSPIAKMRRRIEKHTWERLLLGRI